MYWSLTITTVRCKKLNFKKKRILLYYNELFYNYLCDKISVIIFISFSSASYQDFDVIGKLTCAIGTMIDTSSSHHDVEILLNGIYVGGMCNSWKVFHTSRCCLARFLFLVRWMVLYLKRRKCLILILNNVFYHFERNPSVHYFFFWLYLLFDVWLIVSNK